MFWAVVSAEDVRLVEDFRIPLGDVQQLLPFCFAEGMRLTADFSVYHSQIFVDVCGRESMFAGRGR